MTKTIELELGNVAHGGHFVARHEGRVVFVRHGLPGELVEAKLTQAGENAKFWRADVVKVLESSSHRVPHVWDKADSLKHDIVPGGAEFGHIDLPYQRVLKAQVIKELLARFGGIKDYDVTVEEVAGDAERNGLQWRTRNQFSVSPNGKLAMYQHRSNNLVELDEFPLATEMLDELKVFECDFSGISKVSVATPADGSKPIILVKSAHPSGLMQGYLKDRLVEHFGDKAGVSYTTANATASNVPKVQRGYKKRPAKNVTSVGKLPVEYASGKGYVVEKVLDQEFKVGASGFWQIHRKAPETLVQAVLEAADIKEGQRIADLYSGVGLFTKFIAEKVGEKGKVVCVEASPVTTKNAKENLKGYPQVQIRIGKVERKVLPTDNFDTIVLDPPRSGAGQAVINKLANLGASRLVYIACDPAAMSRDIGYLADYGYELKNLRAFDIYPHTHHVECVVTLVKD
ncbi:MAG: methyltransferase [Micrococcaceae bacterium]